MRHKSRRSIIWGKLYLHNSRRDVVVIGNQLLRECEKRNFDCHLWTFSAINIDHVGHGHYK